MRAYLPGILFSLGVVGLLSWVFGASPNRAATAGNPADAHSGPPPIPVTLAAVVEGVVEDRLELVGDVVSAHRAELGFQRAGEVAELDADLGDSVASGAPLARLDDRVLEEQLAAARRVAEAAEVEAAWAGREAKRAQEVGQTVVSDAERDQKDYQARTARLRAEQARIEVRRLEALLAQGTLSAPFACVISRRAVSPGSFVAAGAVAFEVVDLVHREIHLEIPTVSAVGLEVGAEVTVESDAWPDQVFEARLDALVPAADPASRTLTGVVRLDATVDPKGRLWPGSFVRASLLRRAVHAEAVVPADALREDSQGFHVALLDPGDGKGLPGARIVPVRVLARAPGRVAVAALEGEAIGVGDQVVVIGAELVHPGVKLLPQRG